MPKYLLVGDVHLMSKEETAGKEHCRVALHEYATQGARGQGKSKVTEKRIVQNESRIGS